MVDLVYDVKAQLGEGPIWDEVRARLLFVDIMRGQVHAYDPVSKDDRVYDIGRPVGAVVCAERGDWIVAAGRTFARLNPDTGDLATIAEVSPGRRDIRMNDGYVDPRGRFWAGTMSLTHEAGQGTLYRLDPDGSVHAMVTPVSTSNGIDWSLDGRLMYYIDSRTERVDVFDYDVESGAIANRRTFAEMAKGDGHPDGLIVDAEGGIWVALWRGASLRRYAPDGTLDRVIPIPGVSLVTKCAFAGPMLDDLYVTSAWIDLTDEERPREPHAGSVFRVRPGVRGRPARRFAG